jgi:hypothetical protein
VDKEGLASGPQGEETNVGAGRISAASLLASAGKGAASCDADPGIELDPGIDSDPGIDIESGIDAADLGIEA